MKIRNGWVSNSSSSSFVCEICGNAESGYDMGAGELGFLECVNGHIFCEEHKLELSEKQENEIVKKNKARFLERLDNEGEKNCRSEKEYRRWREDILEDAEDPDAVSEHLDEDDDFEIQAHYCPICTLTFISEKSLLEYMEKTEAVKIEEFRNIIRDEFKDSKELDKFLESKK